MAELKQISLPHGTIPTQMFGNVNLQNAIMYVNENFAEMKSGVNSAISATSDALKEKAASDHTHDDAYAALEHTHGMDAVTGLSAALDGKAELNHEHSQYLSSLPAHYHDVSGIQGLGEQLQAKADKVHSHTTAQVEGLDTKLGVLASTSYVDQQVNSVGSSIKTIADQEIEDYGAAKEGASGSASTDVPKNTEIAPADETVEQKNARVGTANRWARADHKHVFDTETSDVTKLKQDGNGTGGAASFGVETKVPRIDHSHPLNFPEGSGVEYLEKDGAGNGGTPLFGDSLFYADLNHSHPLNVSSSGTPSDVVKPDGTASLGDLTTYARTDHIHKMPQLTGDDIDYISGVTVSDQIQENVESITTNTETLVDHEGRISALESSTGSVSSVDGIGPVNGNVSLSNDTVIVQRTMIGVDDGVQAYSEPLTFLSESLNSDGTIPSECVKDEDCTSGGKCFAYFDANKQLSHLLATTNINVPKANSINACFDHTTSQSGGITASTLKYNAFGAASAPQSKKAVGFEANSETASLIDVATVNEEASAVTDGILMTYKGGEFVEDGNIYPTISELPSADCLVSMDAEGNLNEEVAIPMVVPDADKVLTIKKGGTELSWEDGMSMGTATNPPWQTGANIDSDSSGQPMLNPSGAQQAVQSLMSSWLRGDTDQHGNRVGTKISVCTGITRYTATSSFYAAHFANLSFDENGMLCRCETARSWFRTL